MEYLSQYKHSITYIKGEDNTMADALSQLPVDNGEDEMVVTSTFTIKNGPKLFTKIQLGYAHNTWCKSILNNLEHGVIDRKLDIRLHNGLLFMRSWLIIPKYLDLWKNLFHLAYDHLGHFGEEKTYTSLRNKFYWPKMRQDLLHTYVPACSECQCNKSHTKKMLGPLHPLPIPDKCFNSIAINFVSPLPLDGGFNQIVTMIDRLGANVQLAACTTKTTAEEFTNIFFNTWYCENSCPLQIISDRDKLFILRFWKALMKLMDIKHKLSTAYHPETDGTSE
jgi:hypothetical protein